MEREQTDEEKRQDLYDEAVGQQRAIDRAKAREKKKDRPLRPKGRRPGRR